MGERRGPEDPRCGDGMLEYLSTKFLDMQPVAGVTNLSILFMPNILNV